jgi:DNA-binding NarL/FixJ family response regulator
MDRGGPVGCRIVICDDYEAYRYTVRSVLDLDARFELIGEATNGREAIDVCAELQPDLILLDIAMPVLDGLAALPEIREACPTSRIIMHSAFTESTVAADALARGANGLLEKGTDLGELLDTLARACEDGDEIEDQR